MWYSSSSNCIKYVSVEESELLHGLTLSTQWIHTYTHAHALTSRCIGPRVCKARTTSHKTKACSRLRFRHNMRRRRAK